MTCRRVLALVGLLVGFSSLAAVAVPGFSDRNIAAGNLNPTDTIKVQEIRVTRGTTETVTLSSITVQNLGTAGDGDIDKITVMDGGAELGTTTNIAGLSTGVTITLGFAMTSTTHDLKIYVTVGTAVSGGETVNLRCKVHYVRNGESGSSAWISDLTGEVIRNGGFDVIEDASPDAGYFNPGDVATVQVAVFTDNDANGNPVLWDAEGAVDVIKVENLGTATDVDIQTVSVTVRIGGTDYIVGSKVWPATGGVTFDQSEPFTPALGTDAAADNASMTVTVAMAFRGKNSVVDGHTVRTKITAYVDEQGAGADGERVEFEQSISADTTQTIRKQGFERIEEESESLSSGTAATGDIVVQTIRCYDDDSNADTITAWRVYIRNMGSAAGDEITKIEVKAGATTLCTILPAALAGFKTGTWYTFTTVKLVNDNAEQVFKIYYTIGAPVDGHTLRPVARIEGREPSGAGPWTAEGDDDYPSDEVTYPDELGLYEPGFEFVENWTPPEGGTAYSGQRLLAQTIRLEDRDQDTDNVTIHPVVVKNLGTASGNPDVTKIEVWRRASETATAIKLGETTDLTGFRTGGARVDLTHDNVVTDASGGAVTFLDIYLTIAEPEVMVATRTIQLETRVLHTEKQKSYDKKAVSNQWTLETNHRPVASFTFALATTPASVQAKADFTYEQTIQFTGTATDADGDAIATWSWTFGDGATSALQNPTHRYPNGGTFTVTLTVTDARGVSGSVSKTITVQGPPNVAPTVAFTWTPQAPADITTVVTFASTVTDSDQPTGTAFTYAWDFGDTTTSAVANPTHTFAAKQTYTVKLTVTDAQSAAVTVEHTISVGNTLPVVGTLTASNVSPTTGDPVTFTVGATDADTGDTIASFKWTFAPGATPTTTGTTLTATHTFNAPGIYIVSVIAVDSRGGESVAKTVTVTVSGPTRVIVYAYPNPASTGATFMFLLPDGTTGPVLRIFGIDGRLVLEEELATGATTYSWSLVDSAADPVGNGLYFCIVTGTAAGGGTVRSEIFRLLIAR
jgi:PKD repeat protein